MPLWNNDFVNLDDEIYITRNPRVIDGWTWRDVTWAWSTYHGSYWQPLSWLSLQGDAQLFSHRSPDGQVVLSAAAFHGENLLWHCATVLLLFGLWRRLTGAPWQSFLVAAVFALHPMRVESVAWAAERKDVLSCFFGVLTLWAYVHYLAQPSWLRHLSLIGCFALSLLCKPMLMTLPFVLLLLDYWPLGRLAFVRLPSAQSGEQPRALVSFRQLLREKVPLFVLTAAIMLVTLSARHETWSGPSYEDFPLLDRLAVASSGYGWYLGHTLCPLGLAVIYPHPRFAWSGHAALTGAITVLALTLLCAWQARRRPWLLMGWLWFAGTLAPVMGLALNGDQAWADRFTYWPHIGIFVAIVWQLADIASRWRIPVAVATAAGAIVLGFLTVLTWLQVGYWRNTVTLWDHTLAVTQNNYAAHDHLGNYYAEQHQLDLAVPHFAESARLRPESLSYQFKLGEALHLLGRDKEAAVHLRAVLDLDPDFFPARQMLYQIRLQSVPESRQR